MSGFKLPPELFKAARLFCDLLEQSRRAGEVQHASAELQVAAIGHVLDGRAPRAVDIRDEGPWGLACLSNTVNLTSSELLTGQILVFELSSPRFGTSKPASPKGCLTGFQLSIIRNVTNCRLEG